MNHVNVTVVIPVGPTTEGLNVQLASVLGQRCREPFEVVLSVNTADAAVGREIEQLVHAVDDGRLRTVNSSDRRGAAHARNVGFRSSTSTYVAFCDADDRVHDGWLDALLDGLEEYDAVTGRVIDVFPNDRTASWHPPATPGELPKFLGQQYLLSGNLAVRREAFDTVGGFDEDLTRCEDIALGWSFVRAGHSIGYAESAVLDYNHRSGLVPMLRQHYHYGRGMSEVLHRFGLPSDESWQKASGIRSLKPNAQRVQRRTLGGFLRRGALAAGRISGLVSRSGRSSDKAAENPVTDEHPAQPCAVAYIATHYPAVTHTFIQREVLELRDQGVPVRTFSINSVSDDQMMTEVDRSERSDTFVLKALGARRLLRLISRTAAAHPLAVCSTLGCAWRGVGPDVARLLRRTMQVGEGVLLAGLCRDDGISHIHAHMGQAPANIARFATHFASAAFPDCQATWSVTIHGPQDCLAEPRRLLVEKIEAAAFVVAVSDYTKAQLLWQIPVELWSKVHTVRCGIDLDDPPDFRPRRSGDPFRILVVARISPEKGHGVLLDAVALLHQLGLNVQVELVGPGDFDEVFLDLANRLSIRDLITTTGAVPPHEVTARMRNADVLCLPSFAEGLPIVIMEAMAVGLPVVATGISGIPELVEHDVTGLLVVPARHDLLAAALRRLLVDEELRARIAEQARMRVEQLHNSAVNVERLAQLLREATATGRDRSDDVTDHTRPVRTIPGTHS